MDKAASRIRLQANEVQMKNDAAFATLKTIKNRSENL